MEILENIKNAIQQTSLWEWLAVVSGILYVVLITYKKIAAWFFAIVCSFLYIYICYISKLYLETGLQFFYLVMGIYGWIMWSSKRTILSGEIIKWSNKLHLINIVLSALITLILGWVFDTYTNQANPYTDAFTTVFSLTATFMVTKKVLENWLYWIVIDAVSIYLFSSRELYLTALLFLLYTIIAVFGFFQWKKQFKQQIV